MRQLLVKVYGALALLALLMAIAMAVVFLLALIAGGTIAATLSDVAGHIATYSIVVATAATVFGLLDLYISGKHALTVASETADSGGDLDTRAD